MVRFAVVFTLVLLISFAAADVMVIEAEDAACIDKPANVPRGPMYGPSGGHYVRFPLQWDRPDPFFRGDIRGRLHFIIPITYDARSYVWVRVWACDKWGGDAVRVRACFQWNGRSRKRDRIVDCSQARYRWTWVRCPGSIPFPMGSSNLFIDAWREGIKIDQILITDDRSLVPKGAMKSK